MYSGPPGSKLLQQESWELPERIPGHVAQSCFQQAEVFQTFLELAPGTWLKLFSSSPPKRWLE